MAQSRPPSQWQVTPETARLLQHWRHHKFSGLRPFFCQVEAVETAIWLTEVAPKSPAGKRILDHLASANRDANPELMRLALKLATGAGKTTVMAMLIAWQTINAVRRPGSKHFTRGFLVVAPGLTIKDRLRVLQPNDPDSYYAQPRARARRHARRRQQGQDRHHQLPRLQAARADRALQRRPRSFCKGARATNCNTLETEGQMLQRVMPDLMGMKNILVLNDEAHHCYREKPTDADDEELKGDDRKEAEKNNEAARLWISGLEAVNRKLGLARVIDLSATPFFLRGSGYAEGTLFPWTMSDFSLMDAIECGIVKLPRVPVAENIPGDEMPMFRNLWENIRKDMPKKGRGKGGELDPLKLPDAAADRARGPLRPLREDLRALGGGRASRVPPCFIIVCQNTAISKLVYDYISGFHRKNEDGTHDARERPARAVPQLRRDDRQPARRARTRCSSTASSSNPATRSTTTSASMAADEIERFRREIVERTGDARAGENITDQELLREVMNTVGKPGQLGGSIRCVVSVSMLTEGWDANTVTHVLGVRAFGTQLLCEQVIGRALRRQSYDLNEEGLFNVEYADVFGIPFDFTAKPVVAPPQPPRETVQVKAVRPERDALEIRFPRVEGYRVELPEERLDRRRSTTTRSSSSRPTSSARRSRSNSGIIGEGVDLNLEHLGDMRPSTLLFHLTQRLLYTKWRDPGEEPKLHLFGQLKRITKQWLDTLPRLQGRHLSRRSSCTRSWPTWPATGSPPASRAHFVGERPIKALLDPYNPTGSTAHVRFNTSQDRPLGDRAPTAATSTGSILDSDWEAEFCRVAESHPQVRAYVKNHNLGFEVPYRYGSETRKYLPDFIVLVDDGHGADDLLHLVVEIKGYRARGRQGEEVDDGDLLGARREPPRHATAAGRSPSSPTSIEIEADFEAKVDGEFNEMIDEVQVSVWHRGKPMKSDSSKR